jgi:tRNA threonylcarbamoyladenosine biosynthesis protein TsaE
MKLEILSIADLSEAAHLILEEAKGCRKFRVDGQMGAGKTTLIAEICRQLGVKTGTSSPTFPIINQYQGENDLIIYHLDLYRLKNVEEALNIGVEDVLYDESYCFIEWADLITAYLPADTKTIRITILNEHHRLIELV